jgi:glycosyltransferase involved in cell wall biosynthesis
LIRILAGNKFGRLFANASHIITGSPYLTACALKFNSNVTEIPTSIDIEKYKVAHYEPAGCLKIGWIGSPTTSKYVLGVLEALRMFTKDHTCELVLIGFDKCLESKLAGLPYRIVEWSEETEVNELCKIDVGIMPLDDTPWSRGKCGFKLIQYMACEKPTISTPLEANVKIDNGNGNLFVMATEEWVECFKKVCLNRDAFRQIGIKNRITVETAYTFQSNYKKYIDVFRTVAENE